MTWTGRELSQAGVGEASVADQDTWNSVTIPRSKCFAILQRNRYLPGSSVSLSSADPPGCTSSTSPIGVIPGAYSFASWFSTGMSATSTSVRITTISCLVAPTFSTLNVMSPAGTDVDEGSIE